MKGKTKQQKGITLIALIITIVVLLILAGVAISSITNDGILGYAQSAADKYNKAQKDEAQMLQNYLAFLDPCGTKGSHTFPEEWTVVVAANCKTKTNGMGEKICTECGERITQPIVWKHDGDGETPCTVCGNTCEFNHDDYDTIKTVVSNDTPNDESHYVAYYCEHCNYYWDDGHDRSHTYVNGTCTECNWVCTHELTEFRYEYYDATDHYRNEVCNTCGRVWENKEAHDQSGEVTYTQKDATAHIKVTTCEACGYQSGEGVEEAHDQSGEVTYTQKDATTHLKIIKCELCGYKAESTEAHDQYGDWEYGTVIDENSHKLKVNCEACGYQQEIIEEHNFDGDTIWTEIDEEKHSVSSRCLWCPQVSEPWSEEAHSGETSYTQKDATTHLKTITCEYCEYQSKDFVEEAHTFESGWSDGPTHNCTNCGYYEKCYDPDGYSYAGIIDGVHKHDAQAYCVVCLQCIVDQLDNCTFNANGVCTGCGHVKE